MADTPTPNAILADECAKASYETYDDGLDDYSDLFRRAAAALRAPTIAADDAALVARLTKALASFDEEFRDEALHAAKVRLNATPSPTIAAPSPSNEVTEEMVEAAQAARMAHAERCVDPEVCVDDHGPHETWHGCNFNAMRAAIEAALKARKPSPSQADDAELARYSQRSAANPELADVMEPDDNGAWVAFKDASSRLESLATELREAQAKQ